MNTLHYINATYVLGNAYDIICYISATYLLGNAYDMLHQRNIHTISLNIAKKENFSYCSALHIFH
jgi:hypothetical protein